MKISFKQLAVLGSFVLFLFGGWGSVGHKIINKTTTGSFPASMQQFLYWSDSLAAHASDADNRKSKDKTEGPKHFLDIENFSGWVSTGWLPQTYDSALAVYGSTALTTDGTVPWTILITVDSLTAAFKRRDFSKAILVASDLGHYVGDGHQPLHITANYDGDQTGQSGVHSRYETTMVGNNQSQIVFTAIPAIYVTDKKNFVFDFIYSTHTYVDSVLIADKANTLWASTGAFTIKLFQNASYKLASLIYTAWVDAGSPNIVTGIEEQKNPVVKKDFTVSTYPNPFNGQVTIDYTLPNETFSSNDVVNISLYSPLGELVSNIATLPASAGNNKVHFDSKNLSSGIYYVTLKSGIYSASKKIILMK